MSVPDWPRSFGAPLGRARLKAEPDDFVVEEFLSFAPSGDGPHEFLRIEKVGCNTSWVASRLARHAGVRPRDVGYAGLKDRHARAVQWFSIPSEASGPVNWDSFEAAGLRITEITRNRRKLRRGAIAANRFCLRLRSVRAEAAALSQRMEALRGCGVPNYFGPQRFGIDGGNLALARRLFAGERLDRRRREYALSAARAWLFNQMLACRVRGQSWNRLLPGEIVVLDGRGSVFVAGDDPTPLEGRVEACEIHPTGPLWGLGEPQPQAVAGDLETRVVEGEATYARGLERQGLRMARRSLRLCPRDLDWSLDDDDCRLSFSLPAGEYATTLLRELLDTENERDQLVFSKT